MAKVAAKAVGAAIKEYDDVDTVRELRKEMGLAKEYSATVNGEPQDEDFELSDDEYVVFAPQVKGGAEGEATRLNRGGGGAEGEATSR